MSLMAWDTFHYVMYMNTTSERQVGCVLYNPVHKSSGEKLHNQNKPILSLQILLVYKFL